MGEKIFDLISKIATGEKRRIFWAITIIVLLTLIVIYPYVDANFLYHNRIEKRLDNLSKLVEISGHSISDSPELEVEYQSILSEISLARKKTIWGNSTLSETQGTDYWIKFTGGGFLFAVVGVVGLFTKKKDIKTSPSLFLKNNVMVFVVCSIIAVVFAYVFAKAPTIGSAWINAILSPIVQFVVIYLFMQPQKKNT